VCLKELENRLVHYESSPIPSRDEFEVETINLESVRVFREYGGIDVSKFSHIIVINLIKPLNIYDLSNILLKNLKRF